MSHTLQNGQGKICKTIKFRILVSAHPIGPPGFFAAKAAPTNVPMFCRSGFNRDQSTNGQIGKSSYGYLKLIFQ